MAATVGGGTLFAAVPATAATVNEITAAWADNTPTTVASGDVVTGIWRVNVNDDAPAPGNAPVDNVTVELTATNGTFTALPSLCLTDGVTPASSISADGKTLTCNVGTKNQGSAAVIQAPIKVSGPSGSQVSGAGSIGGQNAALSPLTIQNPFGMDMRWVVASGFQSNGGDFGNGTGYGDLDFQWTLSTKPNSDPGPQSITYNLTTDAPNATSIDVGPNGCTPFDYASGADGHPWSGGNHPADQMTGFVQSCTITKTGPNTFSLTISGIDYSPANVPTKDSTGAALPTDQVAIASGSIWLRAHYSVSGSLTVTSDAPSYTSTTGATANDDPSNNSVAKAWTTPGGYAASWIPSYTGNGGGGWDGTYRIAAGTEVMQNLDDAMPQHTERAGNLPVGHCSIIDTRYATFNRAVWNDPVGGIAGAVIEYFTGNDPTVDPASGSYDPSAFDCGTTGGWTTTAPADPTTVKAVRMTMTQAQAFTAQTATNHIDLGIIQDIKPDVPAGTDVWAFTSSQLDNGTWWTTPASTCITPVAGGRYPCTTGYWDVLHVVTASPSIKKSVDRSVVTPGVPATYTLTYAANGAGAIPATVDGFEISDTLPAGTTYVTGSATPEPSVTTNGSGQQVLTWTLNGVGTNAEHALTYKAVVDDTATPGQALTNTTTASFGGVTTTPATAQVTVATDGYTTIVKSADEQFIPNLDGKGAGSGSWTVTLRSYDPLPQDYTDTIDILPYNGDGRGTSYSGTYTIDQIKAVAGATVYYTTADPATLSDDPEDDSNGAPGTVSGNKVGWSMTFTAKATAVRVIGPKLAPGAVQAFTVPVTTDGAKGGDVLVNRAQARDEHTQLVMRTSAPISVANYYSASIKKEVQDANGNWHDANDAGDYPRFRFGDTVHYRVTVTNTGQGTLTNVKISDDKQPDLGDFTVASLASGAHESHEYSVTLGADSAGGTTVNTACGAADIPADSQVAPTIGCDPAGIDVVGYRVVKTADPAAGTAVKPGQTITYTITVTQQGTVAADASFVDALAAVTDDATYNGDAKADIGNVNVTGNSLNWSGTVPVGGVAHITYTVTVHDAAALQNSDGVLTNPVTSEGCASVADCSTVHEAGSYVYSKTSNPAPGTDVLVGQTIDYTVVVKQVGAAAQPGITVTDDLSKVLDDASWVGNAKATDGDVTRDGDTLTWKGDLAVGQTVTITYSVKVTAAGDTTLTNKVTSPAGVCVPAADENPDCTTTHHAGTFTYSKMSDPTSPATVKIGDTVTYTVNIDQRGTAGVPGARLVDDLSGVLDDATWNNDAKATAGNIVRDGNTLTWTGDLAVGQHVTLTYSVTVAGGGDTTLENTVAVPPGGPQGACVPAPDGTPDCRTVQKYGGYTFSKTSDPKPGSTVNTGDRITYTVTVTQTGASAVDATVTDDLTKVLDDAAWVDNAKASTGTVNRDGNTLTWKGHLDVGATATITYSVDVTGAGDETITNVVTSPDRTAACVPAADQNPDCRTVHKLTKGASAPGLAITGGTVAWGIVGTALLLLVAGGVLLIVRRRRGTDTVPAEGPTEES